MNDLVTTLIASAVLIAIFSPIAITIINDHIDEYIPRGYKIKEVIYEDLSERYYTYFKVFVFWRHYKRSDDQNEYFSTRDEALKKLKARKQGDEEMLNRVKRKKKVYSHEERV